MRATNAVDFTDESQVSEFVHECPGLAHFGRYKSPYFRVTDRELTMSEKYYYPAGGADDMKKALMKALDFLVKVAAAKDYVLCLQLGQLKNYLTEHKLPFKGTAAVLKTSVLNHLVSKIPHTGSEEPSPSIPASPAPVAALTEGSQPTPSAPDAPVIQKKVPKKGSSFGDEKESNIHGEPTKNSEHTGNTENANTSSKTVRGSMACPFFEPALVVQHIAGFSLTTVSPNTSKDTATNEKYGA